MRSIDEKLISMKIPVEIIENIFEDSVVSGEMYYEVCVDCRGYRVCTLISVKLEDIDSFKTVLEGLIIHIDKDRVINEEIETLLRLSRIIKYEGNVAKIYIPPLLSKSAYIVACRDIDWSKYDIRRVPVEEAYLYVGEEKNGNYEDNEMA
ncbi:MAG: hypothetical protein QXP72_05605 [Desulfurococcaceae archaeon]